MKRLIFRFYWALAVVAFGLAIYLTTEVDMKDRLPLLGAGTAGILGFCYFVQQQRLAETLLFKELFTEFNSRYNAMNDRLTAVLLGTATCLGDSTERLDWAWVVEAVTKRGFPP